MELNLKGHIILIDDVDYELIENYTWIIRPGRNTNYAWGYKKGIPVRDQKFIFMHRLIMGAGPGDPQVDHENRNGLDCRRRNLRFITYAGNQRNKICKNKFGFKGVKKTRYGRFFSNIKINGNYIYLGCFDTAEEAGAAYQIAYNDQIKKELF